MTPLPIFCEPRRPIAGLPLLREQLHDAAAAMRDNDRAAELIRLIRLQPAKVRHLIAANLEADHAR
jgi:hypothetical protein